MDTFDSALLDGVDKMSLADAKVHCSQIIEGTRTKAIKKAALMRDIQQAPSSPELSRIMWNVMLAGEGLATTNSKWQATYGKAK